MSVPSFPERKTKFLVSAAILFLVISVIDLLKH